MSNVIQMAPRRNGIEGLDLPLTAAAAYFYRRTRRPIPTCNLLATLAGLKVEG